MQYSLPEIEAVTGAASLRVAIPITRTPARRAGTSSWARAARRVRRWLRRLARRLRGDRPVAPAVPRADALLTALAAAPGTVEVVSCTARWLARATRARRARIVAAPDGALAASTGPGATLPWPWTVDEPPPGRGDWLRRADAGRRVGRWMDRHGIAALVPLWSSDQLVAAVALRGADRPRTRIHGWRERSALVAIVLDRALAQAELQLVRAVCERLRDEAVESLDDDAPRCSTHTAVYRLYSDLQQQLRVPLGIASSMAELAVEQLETGTATQARDTARQALRAMRRASDRAGVVVGRLGEVADAPSGPHRAVTGRSSG